MGIGEEEGKGGREGRIKQEREGRERKGGKRLKKNWRVGARKE